MGLHRFCCMTEAVDKLVETFPSLDRRKATHIVWDFDTPIGTDRGIWLDFDRIKRNAIDVN
jgi:hypothetical protein